MVTTAPKITACVQTNTSRKYQSVHADSASHIAAETNTLRRMKESFISKASQELKTPSSTIVSFFGTAVKPGNRRGAGRRDSKEDARYRSGECPEA
jgi:hypothetical protein